MDLKSLKLQLINRILQTSDPQVLQALAGILNLEAGAPVNPEKLPLSFPPSTTPAPSSGNAREIQTELDQLFTP